MFVEGGDPLDVPVESLTAIPTCDPERREGEPWGGRGLGAVREPLLLPTCTLSPKKMEG